MRAPNHLESILAARLEAPVRAERPGEAPVALPNEAGRGLPRPREVPPGGFGNEKSPFAEALSVCGGDEREWFELYILQVRPLHHISIVLDKVFGKPPVMGKKAMRGGRSAAPRGCARC